MGRSGGGVACALAAFTAGAASVPPPPALSPRAWPHAAPPSAPLAPSLRACGSPPPPPPRRPRPGDAGGG
eukprot:1929928-Pleurochrysis_carterae.AAC.1